MRRIPWDLAVCCSVLQCVAVCCSVLQGVAVCCSVLQCVAVCCSVYVSKEPIPWVPLRFEGAWLLHTVRVLCMSVSSSLSSSPCRTRRQCHRVWPAHDRSVYIIFNCRRVRVVESVSSSPCRGVCRRVRVVESVSSTLSSDRS